MIDLSKYEFWFLTGSQYLYGEETLGVDNLPAKPMSYRAMLKVHNMIEDAENVFEQIDSRVQRNLEEYESNPAANIPRRSIK